ncbi:MAG: hypothetical protein R6U38_09555 [Desulfatiglandaceae bacterium]
MNNSPWKSENWFVSPWNYLDEVKKDFIIPESVKIHDVTLRDGEQQAGVIFTKDDKIRIAEKLSEVGIHRIETGMPAVSPRDEEAIREIVKRDLNSDIFCFCRCMVQDVQLAADCGIDGIVIEIPSSQHLIEKGYKWPMEKAIDLSIKATSFAREQGLYTVFFTIDATRSDIQWLLNLVEKVADEGHMDAFTLVDTFGALNPQAATYFTKKVKERIDKPLEIHFHSDFGLGVANTINAVLSGAEVIHSTVLGIGERAGNTPMEETVMALLTMYGIDVGIDYKKMYSLSQLVRELSGVEIPSCRPLVGDGAYSIESGIVTGWFRNAYDDHPTTLYPVNPAFVGRGEPQILMGKKSGLDNIWVWCDKLGLELDEDDALAVLQAVKLRSHDLKRVLSENEFMAIAEEVKGIR